jgi:hypothetical protein
LRSNQPVTGVTVAMTANVSEINGAIADTAGAPVTDFTVLAFPADASLWSPLSRHIMSARPDQTGKFTLRGLPPGEYYLMTVDPAEQGEWFEPTYLERHRTAASWIVLGDGDVKTHNFKLPAAR